MELLKVMIVDDDLLSVDYIRNLVDWESHGYEVAAVAYNGRQALKLFEKCCPSLVITDISMPLMDGIELIQEVKKKNPDTRTILLTAYSEFEYARAAVDAGVDYYIIKDEMTEEMLAQKLAQIGKAIGNIRHISEILFQKALLDCFLEGVPYALDKYQDQGIQAFFKQPHPCILIERNEECNLWGQKEDTDKSAAEVLSLVLKCAGGADVTQYGLLPAGSLLLFLDGGNGGNDYNKYQTTRQLCGRLLDTLNKCGGDRYTCYYSYLSVPVSYVREFTRHAMKDHAFFHGTGSIYSMQECMEKGTGRSETGKDAGGDGIITNGITADGITTDGSSLFKAGLSSGCGWIREPDVRKALESKEDCSAYLEDVLDPGRWGTEQVRQNIHDLVRILTRVIQERGMDRKDIFGNAGIYDLKEAACCLTEGCSSLLSKSTSGACRSEVRRAMGYIKKNYHREELSISELADYVGISNSRLSVVFKQDTGITVNQYITKVRIDRARELLSEGGYKVYEVAEKVGYGTSQYLSRIFFRETGSYPAEYKRKV